MSPPLNHEALTPLCQNLLDEVKSGNATRQSVIRTAQSIIHAAQDEQELYVHFVVNKVEIIVMRLFLKWEAFEAIPTEGAISFEDLAKKLDADVELISRLTRLLISTGMLSSPTLNHASHTPRSLPIALNPLFRSTMKLILYEDFPQEAGTPEYYAHYGRHHLPREKSHTPYAFAKGQPEKTVFEIMNQNTELMGIFMQAMTKTQEFMACRQLDGPGGGDQTNERYDFTWVWEGDDEGNGERVQIVDVGGGAGHTLAGILSWEKRLNPGRCVLQDREEVIAAVSAKAKNNENGVLLKEVKKMGIDFHREQPVKGAKGYLLRRCLHDYGDDECVNILQRIQSVMEKDSKVLIVEMVLVSGESPPFSYALDLAMMGISGKERTLQEWEGIVSRAGLKVGKVVMGKGIGMSILECVKA
ncbi:O-methyltransferase-domain-containing protein [Apiosordaria backusii]|uniref:O-methyltransferase-domain-containing protein n=1 Tax=Apiosordaria backusii TaxID=314023 RepID=A0AA40AIQ8_9PEZI|nr:O-methyltransferase-domain-containing protein [Apiosordaria backusii]